MEAASPIYTGLEMTVLTTFADGEWHFANEIPGIPRHRSPSVYGFLHKLEGQGYLEMEVSSNRSDGTAYTRYRLTLEGEGLVAEQVSLVRWGITLSSFNMTRNLYAVLRALVNGGRRFTSVTSMCPTVDLQTRNLILRKLEKGGWVVVVRKAPPGMSERCRVKHARLRAYAMPFAKRILLHRIT